MGRNVLYTAEMVMAKQFLIDHNTDGPLMSLIAYLEDNVHNMIHSDRWSLIYDYMEKYYPEATGSLITGLSYLVEL